MFTLAIGDVAKEDQDTSDLSIFPQRRRMCFGITRAAIVTTAAYFKLGIFAFQRLGEIIIGELVTLRCDDTEKTRASRDGKVIILSPLVHPGDAAVVVQCINFVGSAIGDACEKRFVSNGLCFSAAQIGNVSRYHNGARVPALARYRFND